MKKLFALLFAFTFIVFLASPVGAIERPIPSGSASDVRKAALQEKVATREAKLQGIHARNIKKYLTQMITRFEAAALRLERLIEKIESRIEKTEAINNNSSLEEIKESVEEAKAKLAEAKVKIEELKTLAENMVASDSPKEEFQGLRNTVHAIKKDLVETHRILVKVIGDLKGLRN